ncbi:MAG TPA: DUF6178 family protein [Pseudomonadota bacterium]|nr:DUF6178 family protein [Pseudomonadota bacterium]
MTTAFGQADGLVPSMPAARGDNSWLEVGRRPKDVLSDLLARPDAARLVRATPIQSLFLFIQSLGLADAHEIIAMCLPEQVQGFLDLDAWDKDELNVGRMAAWLSHLTELPPQRLAVHLRKLDAEVLTAFLSRHVRVYDVSEEDSVPEEPEGVFFETPDRFFVVDILPTSDGDNDRQAFVGRFLEQLYRGDLDLARTLLVAARWDAGAITDEQAYRFRSGRLADMGFADDFDSLRIYNEVDPQAGPPKKNAEADHRAKPALVVEEVSATGPGGFLSAESGFFAQFFPAFAQDASLFPRAASLLSDEERQTLLQELLYLGNRAMSADRVPFSDLSSAEATLHRTAGYLALGMEQLSAQHAADGDGGAARAASKLRSVRLEFLFRLGYTLTRRIRKLAKCLVDAEATTLVPKQTSASLLKSEEADALSSLLLVRPLYPRVLDDASQTGTRPFVRLQDLKKAAAFLQGLANRPRFLAQGLGVRLETLPEVLAQTSPGLVSATWDDVFGTMVANFLLQRPLALVPLARKDLVSLRGFLWDSAREFPELVRKRLEHCLEQRFVERNLEPAVSRAFFDDSQRAFVERVLRQLAQSLATLPLHLTEETADAVPKLAGLLLL